MDYVWLTALLIACALAPLATALQLPGAWLLAAAATLFAWHTGWIEIGPRVVIGLFVLAFAGELAELLPSMWFSRRIGGSRRSALFGLVGGFIGMIALSSALSLPVPIIGTVAGAIGGAVVGCFAGAWLAELTVRNDARAATRVGTAAAIGRIIGTAGKLSVTLSMSALTAAAALLDSV
jgi:uncharacterized protein YqgC (DUF456 family)